MTLNVSGLGDVPYYQATKEYTSDLVQDTYDTNMQTIQQIFSKKTPFTEADYKKLQDAMDALQNLAKNGDTSTAGGPFSCTELMFKKIGNVFTLLQNAGLTPGSPNPDVSAAIQNMQMLQQWTAKNPDNTVQKAPDGTPITFSFIVTQATLGVSGSNLSLQSQVMTDFIIKGNQYYMDQLGQLQQSMQTGVTVQQLLAQLQELRNANISIPPAPNPVSGTSPAINAPVPPSISHNAQIGQNILNIRDKLIEQIKFLTTPPPAGAGQDINNPGSLAGQLQGVVNGINEAFNANPVWRGDQQLDMGAFTWLMDGKNDTTNAGKYSGQIAQAMAGSGSFNSTQRDNFNQTQKAADQIYTISASVLQTLSDMIKKMADNAAR